MKAAELKELIYLKVDSFLGKYTVNNKEFPAIWVGTPPINVKKTGLEILIPTNPDSVEQKGNVIFQDWTITLIENTNDAFKFQGCLNALKSIYPCRIRYLDHRNNLPSVLNFAEITYYDCELN